MNEEIKEILEELQRKNDRYNYYLKEDISFSDEDYKSHLLLDYITNLQQENERLKKNLKKKPSILAFDYTSDVYKELYDYKSRNEKAIKHIEEEAIIYDSYDGEDSFLEDINQNYCNELLNKLQGSDKE